MSADAAAGQARSASDAGADALFALSRDLLCSLTLDGRFVRVSSSCTRLTGHPPQRLEGQPLASFVHPLDRPHLERALARLRERGYADDMPIRFRTPKGGHVPLRWSAAADRHHGLVLAVARTLKHERERTERRRARAALKAAAAERARLTADLHDGLLQSLTGVSLQLESAARLLDADPVAARRLLASAAELLHQEQRDLRFLVEEMKQGWSERRERARVPLDERLAGFARRLHAVWGIELLSFHTGRDTLPARLVRPAFGVIHEAVVNAARHGRATAATVQIDVADDRVRVYINDNGSGLPFTGTLDDAALRASDQGPAVLKHRVWSLGGTLSIDSRGHGAAMTIVIPFEDQN